VTHTDLDRYSRTEDGADPRARLREQPEPRCNASEGRQIRAPLAIPVNIGYGYWI